MTRRLATAAPVRLVAVAALAVIVLAACAAGANPAAGTPAADGEVAGFWLGLWHGAIAPVTWVISLFDSDVSFYEVHNDGNWYDVAFALGAGLWVGGASRAPARPRRSG
jgi:hypothetical protein